MSDPAESTILPKTPEFVIASAPFALVLTGVEIRTPAEPICSSEKSPSVNTGKVELYFPLELVMSARPEVSILSPPFAPSDVGNSEINEVNL